MKALQRPNTHKNPNGRHARMLHFRLHATALSCTRHYKSYRHERGDRLAFAGRATRYTIGGRLPRVMDEVGWVTTPRTSTAQVGASQGVGRCDAPALQSSRSVHTGCRNIQSWTGCR